MPNEPLISVIMPAYNCELYINQAIDSILNQTYQSFELLICDDCSTDSTREVVDKYRSIDQRIKIFHNDKNLGELQTRNKLLNISNGMLIAFQDADDYSDNRRLELQAKTLTDNDLAMVGCQVAVVDKRNRILRVNSKRCEYKDILANIGRENQFGGATMMIKRKALDSIGGKYRMFFDRLSCLDYDLSYLLSEKYPCINLPEVLYFYRQHPDAVSKTIDIKRYLAHKIVQFLARQREEQGIDDLMLGNEKRLNQFFDEICAPYISDQSLVYRDYAANFMHNRLYKKAIATSWEAVKKRPTKWLNWMTLQYCIRKSILSIFNHGI